MTSLLQRTHEQKLAEKVARGPGRARHWAEQTGGDDSLDDIIKQKKADAENLFSARVSAYRRVKDGVNRDLVSVADLAMAGAYDADALYKEALEAGLLSTTGRIDTRRDDAWEFVLAHPALPEVFEAGEK